ncbi:DUF3788 domain-containing protein [Candidatus Bathyarchaeota archaeon]|nr:DUF3788 domain-containing protein [Candidatus Bathyarchaeota archaeon]
MLKRERGVLLTDMGQDFHRMTDKINKPTKQKIMSFIGEPAKKAWLDVRQFIEDYYGLVPETVFYGAKYGWTIRYRKSGKTLCSLFPEKGGFTVLVVLGKKESEKALSMRDELSSKIRNFLEDTEQLHDGRWLWLRILTTSDANDVKKLLQIKRKPNKT